MRIIFITYFLIFVFSALLSAEELFLAQRETSTLYSNQLGEQDEEEKGKLDITEYKLEEFKKRYQLSSQLLEEQEKLLSNIQSILSDFSQKEEDLSLNLRKINQKLKDAEIKLKQLDKDAYPLQQDVEIEEMAMEEEYAPEEKDKLIFQLQADLQEALQKEESF